MAYQVVSPFGPPIAETQTEPNSNMLAIGAFAILILFILLLFAFAYSNKSVTAISPNVVVTPTQTINPLVRFTYRLDSPPISADLQDILTYLLERGTYASTNQPFSDSVNTALKQFSRWDLASASPPTYYYRSVDQNHQFLIYYSNEYGIWQIKPAL